MNPFLSTERDWPEDATHENGNYLCLCSTCGEYFTGYKRRHTCKVCRKTHEEWWNSLTPEDRTRREADMTRQCQEIITKLLDKPGQD